MNEPDDVFRSLRWYTAMMLGSPPWTVRLQRTRVSDDQRPVAILEPGLLGTPFARRSIPQGDVQKQQTMTIVCYPVIGATAVESAETARQLAQLLDDGFSRGLVTDAVPPTNIGAPFRVPVWDYAGVPLAGATRGNVVDHPPSAGSERPNVAPNPYMYADVDQTFNVRPVQDAMDELRYTVVCALRLSWWQGGRVRPVAPLATGGVTTTGWGGPAPP